MQKSIELWIVLWAASLAAVLFAPHNGATPAVVEAPRRPTTKARPFLPRRIIVRFSPKGGGAALVVWHMDQARTSLLVASYQWSHPEIHAAFLRARARGVKVRIILDPMMEHARSSLLPDLIKDGLTDAELRVDSHHPIFHNKVTVRDGDGPDRAWSAVENGSMNYSMSGDEENAENAQVIEGEAAVAAAYVADLERHWAHARPARIE